MIVCLIGLAVMVSAQEPSVKLDLKPFEKEDKNNDRILTHEQFIDGLGRAFKSAVFFS